MNEKLKQEEGTGVGKEAEQNFVKFFNQHSVELTLAEMATIELEIDKLRNKIIEEKITVEDAIKTILGYLGTDKSKMQKLQNIKPEKVDNLGQQAFKQYINILSKIKKTNQTSDQDLQKLSQVEKHFFNSLPQTEYVSKSNASLITENQSDTLGDQTEPESDIHITETQQEFIQFYNKHLHEIILDEIVIMEKKLTELRDKLDRSEIELPKALEKIVGYLGADKEIIKRLRDIDPAELKELEQTAFRQYIDFIERFKKESNQLEIINKLLKDLYVISDTFQEINPELSKRLSKVEDEAEKKKIFQEHNPNNKQLNKSQEIFRGWLGNVLSPIALELQNQITLMKK